MKCMALWGKSEGFNQHTLLWNSMSRVLSSRVVMLGSNPCLTTCASFSGAWDKTDNGLYEPHWTTFPIPTTVGYLRNARKDVVYNSCCKWCSALCACVQVSLVPGPSTPQVFLLLVQVMMQYSLLHCSYERYAGKTKTSVTTITQQIATMARCH